MNSQGDGAPPPIVAQRRTGFNGLPEPEDLAEIRDDRIVNTDSGLDVQSRTTAATVGWVAFAAVLISSLFAFRTVLQHSRRRSLSGYARGGWRPGAGIANTDVTPPHGDKLLSRPPRVL